MGGTECLGIYVKNKVLGDEIRGTYEQSIYVDIPTMRFQD